MAATKSQLLEHALDLPALAAPPGLTHNFVNPSALETNYYIDLVLCMTVSFLVVCMRMWTKARLIRKFGLEDWVCLIAFTLFGVFCAYMFYLVKDGGVGEHQWNIKLKNLPNHLYQTRVAEVVYCLAVFTIKLAILLEFLRIFSPGKNHNTFWIYLIFIWLNFLFYVIVSFLIIFPCQPIKKFWKPWIDGRCLNTTKVNIAIAGFNSASDLCLLILPQKVIWDLQMSFKRRIGVSAIFLAGLFAFFTSLIRLYYSIRLMKSGDFNYHAALIGFWSLGEMASGFLAMCLPVSPKFFQSLKQITISSLIPITGSFLRRSSTTATDSYLSQFNLPQKLEKTSTVLPVKQESSPISRPVGPVSGGLTPIGGSFSFAKLERDNPHILRCIEISTSTKDERFDASKPDLPTRW